MGRRLAEFTAIFAVVCAVTYLLSQVGRYAYRSALTLNPKPSVASLIIRQPPDEHIFLPFLNVRLREIHDSWHEPRSGRRKHEGQDIFAPMGTEIYSASGGIVIKQGEAGKGGHVVSILGAGGRIYYYAHLMHFTGHLCVGDQVTTDTLIGYVGISGNAVGTPPHLHFGVYDWAGAINPLPLLINRPRAGHARH